MKQITFNVPDDTIIMHCMVIRHKKTENGRMDADIGAEFYDLRSGQTEFTPIIKDGYSQNTGGESDGNA